MNFRMGAFLAAAAMLVLWRGALAVGKRRGIPFFGESRQTSEWDAKRLLLASFLTLFAELAFIRWIAVEVRVFAYFKNLALLLCFLGFGLGCALVSERSRWAPALKGFLGLLLLVRVPWRSGRLLETLSQTLGGAGDIGIWGTPSATGWAYFLIAVVIAGCLFTLIVTVFIPLGQVVSQQMDRASSSLHAYSWNLLGSVIGVVLFLLVSYWRLPPSVWMGAVLVGFAFLQGSRRDALLTASLVLPLALLLHDPSQPGRQILWTPYQQVQYTRAYTATGELWGGTLLVNHTLYQQTVNLSPEFLARYPVLRDEANYNPYNLPFRFAVLSPRVLIVGSGTGNDVAAALRHNSRMVDAVEIDPAIVDLGRQEHPEHPYDSPRVSIHVQDARNFLKRTRAEYDLILFGLLDSHAQFSDYSNMRIDNYVYTEEAFREAARHLSPAGIIFVKFQVDRPWLAARLSRILTAAVGGPPLIFGAESKYSLGATCFVESRSNRAEETLTQNPELASFVARNQGPALDKAVPITTDDWPYLYQRDHRVPRTYYSVSLLVILIAMALYSQLGRAGPSGNRFSLFFFSMGAGFLLLETQIISRLALFFGTVWQVNGIVISMLLLALLLANIAVERLNIRPTAWVWAFLLASLALIYWFPFSRIQASLTATGIVAVVIFSVPVLFAGILFSAEFKNTASPSAALKANVLGAVTGGLLENLSLVFGLRALVLVAIILYVLAWLGFLRIGPTRRVPQVTDHALAP